MSDYELDAALVIVDDQTRLILAAVLMGMMFTVALSLRLADFRRVAAQPGRVVGGLSLQILGLPLLTLALIWLLQPPASLALGMIVVAACPGGNVSNLMTQFSRGNAAYSVSLTTVSSVSAALVTPVSILAFASLYPPTSELVGQLDIGAAPFLIQTATLLGLPLVAGMALASWRPGLAARLRAVLAPLAMLGIAALVAIGMVQNWGLILAAGTLVAPLVLLHNSSAFALGYAGGWALRLDRARRRALTFEVGIQNAGLGLLILLNQFDGIGGAAALVGLWSIWHLVAGSLLTGLFRRLDHRTLGRHARTRRATGA
ncbi:bile acid:sodium symporter family protein [Maricaulis sp. CAU 1757]